MAEDELVEIAKRELCSNDQRVQLVRENGQTVGSTAASNAERMAAALTPRYGPLTVVPA